MFTGHLHSLLPLAAGQEKRIVLFFLTNLFTVFKKKKIKTWLCVSLGEFSFPLDQVIFVLNSCLDPMLTELIN